MKSLKTEIHINALTSEVWDVLMTFETYSDWNPFITFIEGNAKKGGKLTIQIAPEGNKPMTIKPNVLVNEENSEFRWLGHMFIPGLFDGEHYFQLIEEDGGTKFIHGEKFSGVFSGLIMKIIGESTKMGFIAMNEALKNRVENNGK